MKEKFEIIHTETAETIVKNPQWNMPYVPVIKVLAGKLLHISGVNAAPIYHCYPHKAKEFDDLNFSSENQEKLTMENLQKILSIAGVRLR